MATLIQIELDNARERYAQLMKQGRKDTISAIVLSRIQQEINSLERQHDKSERQESVKHRATDRAAQCAKENSYRSRYNSNGSDYSIYTVLATEAS